MIHTLENVGETKLTQSKALSIIKYWQEKLRLMDWELGISTLPPSRGHDMEISMTPTRKCAAIRISSKCWHYPEDRFNYLIIHELLHIVFEPIEDAYQGKAGVYYHQRQVEVAIDHLAKVLYDSNT